MGLINQYPYTDMHSINLDYVIKLCRENMGLHLEISGEQLLLKTEDGTVISAVTIPYSTEANHANTATSALNANAASTALTANYATSAGTAATADSAANATHATTADSATTASSATSASSATYATSAGSATTATHATTADSATYAETTGSVNHAAKAVETISINGNQLRFSTYDGTNYDIEVPYSVKALKDDLGNVIKSTYIASVVNDPQTGKLQFLDVSGNVIVELVPTVNKATNDSYNNLIADFIKVISVAADSNYVTVTHGTGTVESLQIHYSETAWKDTNGNVIKNSYIKRLACEQDPNDHKYKLVAYNGDTPEAEIFRIELTCENARNSLHADTADTADYATNSNYANNAAYATSAGTATTSTGSVSSITRDRTKLTITNGDGTSSEIDLFTASQKYLYMKDTINSNTNLFDPSFTVGHSEEIGIENYNNPWGFNTAWEAFSYGIELEYSDSDSYVNFITFVEQGHYYDSGDITSCYQIKVFDPTAAAIKVFNIDEPADPELTPGNVKVTRVL